MLDTHLINTWYIRIHVIRVANAKQNHSHISITAWDAGYIVLVAVGQMHWLPGPKRFLGCRCRAGPHQERSGRDGQDSGIAG